jgi:CubicO group peptidase (beta-lactamase class C family)
LALYDGRPSFRWTTLEYYLPMFNALPPKFRPGERTAYSNAGFILLGLVIEAVSKMNYHRYIEENIIAPLSLTHTGFYRMNNLPGNTALGYTDNGVTNVLFMPVVGGSDGGLFSCAKDIDALWRGVFACKLFSEGMLAKFITPHGQFGLGVYVHEAAASAYYTVGGDFGVDFFSVYFPETETVATALGNTETNTYPLMEKLLEHLN